ncbi:MAG: acyltransferase [Fibrella sp.]|nr:acyltransferase [Armatimonadota bacterium]
MGVQAVSSRFGVSDDRFKRLLRDPFGSVALAWQLAVSAWQARGCTQVGRFLCVEGKLLIKNRGELRLGERMRIHATHVPVELAVLEGATLEIGDRTFINSGVSICASKSVRIGRNVAVGNYSLIMDTDFHTPGDHTQPPVSLPVIIEDDVWLGARVTVLKGVTIGRGATVAAGAVVTRNVAPDSIVGGIPARLLKPKAPSDITPEGGDQPQTFSGGSN